MILTIKEELANDELILILDQYGSTFTCCEDEHDVADHIIFMDGGVVVEQGEAKQVINNPQEERTKQFLSRYTQG